MESRRRKWTSWIHLSVILALVVTLLSACGTVNVEESYPLESVNGSGSTTSYVYRAAGQTVPEVAAELAAKQKPQQQSPEDEERMFLVYSDQVIHVQKDESHPEDTLIEVDSKDYVRQNYSPSFLEGYLLASFIGSLFDSVPSRSYGDYRGYGSQTTKPPKTGTYRAPTASDTKAAPPMTVTRKGSIFKRGTSSDGGGAGSDGLFGKKPQDYSKSSGTSGRITRNKNGGSGSSGSSGWLNPRKSSPRTKFGGSGRISRRR
ncbi:DUF4247 domain-containing protein [Cohnella sp. AR92]|uniref:DUF4247 domain-containing protein n=1 Tax=Cohnella sp. AR92 TaxID=648716 RepID=UPI000F8E4667|nr:DUF4247 domain-containing protein [Cohnella sp. AR92]RUS49160.1 DUF4247 domain-containing protein [Cohnella sp. AR92]